MFCNQAIPIFSPAEAKAAFPVPSSEKQKLQDSIHLCRRIIEKKERRTAIFVGPCSIHEEEGALEYARRVKDLQEKTKDQFYFIMRIFIEKSRSKFGWRGFLHDPHLDGSYLFEEGVKRVRLLFAELLRLGIPISCELLDPFAVQYYSDLISWGFIGARTSLSAIHRQMASSFFFPVGFKNSLEGNVDVALSGAMVARRKSIFPGLSEKGAVSRIIAAGNPFSHVVLRGSLQSANYYPRDVERTILLQMKDSFPNGIVIDCSHGNAKKQPNLQKLAFNSVIEQISHGNRWIKGLMLESFIHGGAQSLEEEKQLISGQSVTDPCLGWDETEDLILTSYEKLRSAVN